jgi:hypothetical protein
LVVYAVLAPSYIVDGDNAELATVGAIGGRPHPSGYPIYVMYLRAWSWLPVSPAHAAALATVLLSAALVCVLHAACKAWGARPLAASAAVAMYAASPVVLRMHTEAEVFALNGLVAATVLWLSATEGPLRGIARVGALGLVAGLGMSNHLTCVLVAPIGLLGAVRGVREVAGNRRATAALSGIGGLAVGLCAYAYLLVADGPASFGRVESVGDVLDFFLRTDYGGAGSFVPSDHEVPPLTNLRALAGTLGRGWLYVPALAGVAMLGYACVRPTGETRAAWIALAVSWLVAGPLLVLRFNIDPVGLGLYVIQRFHLLPLLLLAPPIAVALDRAATWLAPRAPRLQSPRLLEGLSVATFLLLVLVTLPWLRAAHSPAMQRGVENILRSLPPRAVVIANSEDLCFGADYVEHALGIRDDVDIVCWIVTSRQWYRDRMAARGIDIRGEFSIEITPAQADSIMASGRPLFVDRSQKQTIAARPNYPYGAIIRILPANEKTPSLQEVVELNRRLFSEFDLAYERPTKHADWAAVMHSRYALTWVTLAAALERTGDKAGAEQAWELARQLQPVRE